MSSSNASPMKTKYLWSLVAALSAAVLVLAGTLVRTHSVQTPVPAALIAAPKETAPVLQRVNETNGNDKPTSAAQQADKHKSKRPVMVMARSATMPVPIPPMPVQPSASSVAAAPTPTLASIPEPICQACGQVEAVTALERAGPTNGLGAAAGGVMGAIVGNEMGGENRIIGAVLGAVGGAFAGRALEQHSRTETLYQVQLRMEDGSSRTLQVGQAPSVGGKVTLEEFGLRTPDGILYLLAR